MKFGDSRSGSIRTVGAKWPRLISLGPARLAVIRSLYEGGATSSVGAPPWWKIRDFVSSLRYGVMTTTNGQMDRQTDRRNLL